MKCTILVMIFVFCSLQPINAQTRKLKFSGDMGLSGDWYNMESDSDDAVKPRRPSSTGRFVMNAALSYGKFSLPVSIMLSRGQRSVILPQIPSGNFIDYIRDPSNRIGIAPKYKWMELLLGTQVPQYSELSIGDLPMFGMGVNLTPGWFRASFFSGTTQWAIEEDTLNRIEGVYRRRIHSAKLGIGKEEGSHLYLIGSIMEDDTTSLRRKPQFTLPQKGVLTSLDYALNLSKDYQLKGEIAVSAFTRDTRQPVLDSLLADVKIPLDLFQIQQSTRFDGASTIGLTKKGKVFSFQTGLKYIGDGFVAPGYPFLQTDRMEARFSPGFNLFKSKLQLRFSILHRFNNLSGTKQATTRQTLGEADIQYQLTERLSLAANYSNFDYRNNLTNDTLRIRMITSSWSFSPVYTVNSSTLSQVIAFQLAQNVFRDYNVISGKLSDNNAWSAILSYNGTKIKTPLSFNGSLSYFRNAVAVGAFTTRTFNAGVGYKFFKSKLSLQVGSGLNQNEILGSLSSQVISTIGCKWIINTKTALAVNGSFNMFRYGNERPGISYTESLIRASLNYKF